MAPDRPGLRIGFQVWGQFTTWPRLAGAARDIEALGFDSLWSNDHFFPAAGAQAATPDGLAGPILEGWLTLAGFAAETARIPLGVLVCGAGYRNPALLVKMATTLDHVSGGRVSLGLGAGWHQRDHAAFGFELPPLRERLDRLDEQSAAIRALLDGGAVTVRGRWVTLDRAINDPPPLGGLPLMIGGSGERRTLPIVARDADAWNGEGEVALWAQRNAVLDDRCRARGRDPATIRRTCGLPPACIRSTREKAVEALAGWLVGHGLPADEARASAASSPVCGTREQVISALVAYRAAGVDEVLIDWPAPFDRETMEALALIRSDGLG